MGLGKDLLFVLAVALVTWGGVFFYLLRLEQLARSLERQVEELEPEKLTNVD